MALNDYIFAEEKMNKKQLLAQCPLKALVLSDIHGRVESLEKIVAKAKKWDFVLLLGDLTNYDKGEDAEKILKPLKGRKIFGFAGNLDTAAVQELIEEKGISLHAKKKEIGEWNLVGFGGGLIGNPGRFLFSEEEIRKKLQVLMRGNGRVVLLTHLPPFGTKIDLAGNGKHIGSKAVREIILQKQPALHLCGHCHEAFGEEKLGKTMCINVGAVKEGKAMLLEFGEELKWKRIQL